MFLRALCLSTDSDGGGLPDWWQIYWFGSTGVDPYGDDDEDGWTNIEEYQNGTSPESFNTPPAPRGLQARFVGSDTALISWIQPVGNILSYQVLKDPPGSEGATITNVPAYATSMEDTGILPDHDVERFYYRYQVRAQYPDGYSEWSAPALLRNEAGTVSGQFARGTDCKLRIVLSGTHPDTIGVRLTRYDTSEYPPLIDHFEIPLTSFTNGICTLPEEWAPLYNKFGWWLQSISDDGRYGEAVGIGPLDWWVKAIYPFYDGREAMKQNLEFQLRAANVDDELWFYWARSSGGWPYVVDELWALPEYAYSGFWNMTVPEWDYPAAAYHDEALNPFIENHLYRNFVFTFDDVTYWGFLNTGVDWPYYDGVPAVVDPKYELSWPQSSSLPGLLLNSTQSEWIYAPRRDWNYIESYGMTETQTGYRLEQNARNLYGLPIVGIKNVWSNHPSAQVTIGPGQETPGNGVFYMKTATPQLETVEYYFAQKSPYHPWLFGPAPVPGQAEFSVTNTTPLIIAALGDGTFQIGGWAKQRIVNGYAYKFAYLGQYFEKAYKIDFNGQITTNETGILSPYGEFTPLEPGPVALVTMTNWGVNERGTAVVHVVSLALDRNHDGVMDLSYTGPDTATWERPFRFWINDSQDSGDDKGDGIPGQQVPNAPAYGAPYDLINGTRDLVNFFPVLLNIRSLLQSQSSITNLTFTLKQADDALFFIETDLMPDHFRDYLTDTNFPNSLSSAPVSSPWGGPSPVRSIGTVLKTNFLTRIRDWGTGVILVEACKATTAPLVLQVSRGETVLAETSLHLSIGGVEAMFRHKNLVAETFPNTSSLGAPADRLTDANVPNEPETNDKNFVFLHGYNVNPNQARGAFADIFKRMYWSGSQAKFYGVTWKGSESQGSLRIAGIPISGVTPNYHTNVANAFLTAPALASFLSTLTNGSTVIAAHSLGNMVVLSSLSDWGAPFEKYFMIDAAVAMEAIDGGNSSVSTNMIYPLAMFGGQTHPGWHPYARRLYASDWFRLFPSGDGRSSLSWSNRLANLPVEKIYNFYSSGEEVLREYPDGAPPYDLLSSIPEQIAAWWNGSQGAYAWVWQEKAKGRATSDNFLGSTHGGWKFSTSTNYTTNYFYLDGWVTNMLSPAEVANVPSEQLRTNAFFQMTSASFLADGALYPASGDTYATSNRNRILSDAIPALTLPIGANPVPTLSPQGQQDRNFNMQAEFQNGWPEDRLETEEGHRWHHSDFKNMAYTFVYPLFDDFVNRGNLQ